MLSISCVASPQSLCDTNFSSKLTRSRICTARWSSSSFSMCSTRPAFVMLALASAIRLSMSMQWFITRSPSARLTARGIWIWMRIDNASSLPPVA